MKCNLHDQRRAKWGVSWTLAIDSPYTYDNYDTNDGDSMTVMIQVRFEG